LLIRLLVNQ